MRRRPAIPLLVALAPLLGGAASRIETPSALSAAGWAKGQWHGIAPARFEPTPNGGLHILGQAQGSFVWRSVAGTAACLSWRWRVDQGPPPTPLDRRGGDDRAIAVAVGFDGWPPGVTAWQRAQHAMAQTIAGDHRLPRSVLIYVWGGTGREPAPFPSPYLAGIGQVRVLRPADAPRGEWREERVDLAADWRAAFGGSAPPPLLEIVVGTDVDDTRSRVDARIEAIRFGACRP
ncbi:MAG TPA: DUF3047 domain-containing protein [Acetobacteraceae bacterium]|nr:DUF3047 domain-containing protein [Acetobacteraceae bacterium]